MNALPVGEMPDDILANWEWALQYEPAAIKECLFDLLVRHATRDQDLRQATDYQFMAADQTDLQIRCRRVTSTRQRRDVSVRTKARGRGVTEFEKFRAGHGDAMLTAWIGAGGVLCDFICISLNAFRSSGCIDAPCVQDKRNSDGSAASYWHWEKLQDYGCIISGIGHVNSSVQFRMASKSPDGLLHSCRLSRCY